MPHLATLTVLYKSVTQRSQDWLVGFILISSLSFSVNYTCVKNVNLRLNWSYCHYICLNSQTSHSALKNPEVGLMGF